MLNVPPSTNSGQDSMRAGVQFHLNTSFSKQKQVKRLCCDQKYLTCCIHPEHHLPEQSSSLTGKLCFSEGKLCLKDQMHYSIR